MMGLQGKTIILGVCGGIAAYKSADLASKLIKAGAEVHVIMTESAKHFVGAATFQGLTRHKVYSHVIVEEKDGQIAHIDLADTADLVVVAPATAQTIGKLASGFAGDMLQAVILATKAPVWIAPAMNVNMYAHPAVQNNLQMLRSFGYQLIGPDQGRLACGWTGKGRMVDPACLFAEVESYFSQVRPGPLTGKKIIVTAGPTREAIDPVRYFSNYSSGKMGYAIAEAAALAGGQVILISGPTALKAPEAVSKLIRVNSASEMYEAVLGEYADADAVIKAAAVADYRPVQISRQKIKKSAGPMQIEMVRNPDILKELGRRKEEQILIGFAAETENLDEYAMKKLGSKNLDLLIANKVEDGFGKDTNTVIFYFADGTRQSLVQQSKHRIAEQICDCLASLLEVNGAR